jgi:hypothetical protein
MNVSYGILPLVPLIGWLGSCETTAFGCKDGLPHRLYRRINHDCRCAFMGYRIR